MDERQSLEARYEVAAVMRGRRSIDLYEPREIGTTELLEAIDTARWAPNHRLTEPWRFYLLGKQTAAGVVELAAEIDSAAKGEAAGAKRRARLLAIPGFFVLTSRRSEEPLQDREDYAACCCAAENLMIYLWACGIGVKWTTGGMTRQPRFFELLGIDPAKEVVVGFFWYGWPKVIPTQQRREVAEIVTQLP